jgi:hypothetical protein
MLVPVAILDNHVELVRGQHKVPVRTARIEVSAFQGNFDLSRQDMQATARVEAICLRGECPLLARRGEPWTLSGYAAGLPRLSLLVLPVEVADVLPLGENRWHRVYVVDCVIVSRPVLDDPYGLFPDGIPEGEIDLGQLVRLLSEGVRGVEEARFTAEGGFRVPGR